MGSVLKVKTSWSNHGRVNSSPGLFTVSISDCLFSALNLMQNNSVIISLKEKAIDYFVFYSLYNGQQQSLQNWNIWVSYACIFSLGRFKVSNSSLYNNIVELVTFIRVYRK